MAEGSRAPREAATNHPVERCQSEEPEASANNWHHDHPVRADIVNGLSHIFDRPANGFGRLALDQPVNSLFNGAHLFARPADHRTVGYIALDQPGHYLPKRRLPAFGRAGNGANQYYQQADYYDKDWNRSHCRSIDSVGDSYESSEVSAVVETFTLTEKYASLQHRRWN